MSFETPGQPACGSTCAHATRTCRCLHALDTAPCAAHARRCRTWMPLACHGMLRPMCGMSPDVGKGGRICLGKLIARLITGWFELRPVDVCPIGTRHAVAGGKDVSAVILIEGSFNGQPSGFFAASIDNVSQVPRIPRPYDEGDGFRARAIGACANLDDGHLISGRILALVHPVNRPGNPAPCSK